MYWNTCKNCKKARSFIFTIVSLLILIIEGVSITVLSQLLTVTVKSPEEKHVGLVSRFTN